MKVALRWFLGLYLLLLGSEELFKGPGWVYVSAVCLFAVFVTGLIVQAIRIRFSFTGAMMILFGVVAALSIFWSADTELTTHYALTLAQLLATTWITFSCLEDEASLELIAWWLLLSPLVPSGFLIHDFLTGSNTSAALSKAVRNFGPRMTFAGADPNLAAYRSAVAAIAGIYLGLTSRRIYRRILVYALVAFVTAASLLSGSRGGAMALVAGVVVLLVGSAGRRRLTVLVTLAGFAVLLMASIPYLPPEISSRYLGIGQEISTGSMANRKFIYREGIQSFNQRPTLGVGFLVFSVASRQHGGIGQAAHNDPLEVLLDLGLIGFAVYMAILCGIAGKAFAAPPESRPFMLALLVSYLVSGFSITLIGSKLPWAVFGIIMAVGGFKRPAAQPRVLGWARPPLGAVSHE